MLLLVEEEQLVATEEEEGHVDPLIQKVLYLIQEQFGSDDGTMY